MVLYAFNLLSVRITGGDEMDEGWSLFPQTFLVKDDDYGLGIKLDYLERNQQFPKHDSDNKL